MRELLMSTPDPLEIDDITFERQENTSRKILQVCSATEIRRIEQDKSTFGTKPLTVWQAVKFPVPRRPMLRPISTDLQERVDEWF